MDITSILLRGQLGRLGGITAVFGIDMNNKGAVNLIRGLVGSGGIAGAGSQMAATLLKVVPGINLINASVPPL